MVVVILVDPQDSRNVGSVARLCANFDVENLIVVSPKQIEKQKSRNERILKRKTTEDGVAASQIPVVTTTMEDHSFDFSYWSQSARLATDDGVPILKNARVYGSLQEALVGIDRVIAFTGKRGDNFRIPNVQVLDLPSSVMMMNTAFVFGNEARGLSTDDLMLCSMICTIPTGQRCSSLNLSHAVGVVLSQMYFHMKPMSSASASASVPSSSAAVVVSNDDNDNTNDIGNSCSHGGDDGDMNARASDVEVGALVEHCRESLEKRGYPASTEDWAPSGLRKNKFAFRMHKHVCRFVQAVHRSNPLKNEVESIKAVINMLAQGHIKSKE